MLPYTSAVLQVQAACLMPNEPTKSLCFLILQLH